MTIESILVSENSENISSMTTVDDSEHNDLRKQQKTIDFKMVTFSLSGKDYAIDIMYIKEIAKAGNFTYVPNVLPFIVGVYNLRGEIIPILDMRIFFNVKNLKNEKSELENLLILNIEDQVFGVIVDKIDKVVGVQKSSIQPPHPLFSDVNIKYISGVVENNKRLYILLDIERIFSRNTSEQSSSDKKVFNKPLDVVKIVEKIDKKNISETLVQENKIDETKKEHVLPPVDMINDSKETILENDSNYQFIVEGLKKYKNFFVSDINSNWISHHYEEWKKDKSANSLQIKNEEEASLFLSEFWSKDSDGWWSKEYADDIFNILPDNSAKQIVVWNPGCGKGTETYCLACILAKKYPSSIIKIYAQDIDLLNVSNAPLLSVPDSVSNSWLSSYLVKNVAGHYTFSKNIKDSIMFEYHDCLHTNALPVSDIIFARDLLSFIDSESQKSVIIDFDEKLKGNGVLFIGENEELSNSSEFIEYTAGDVTAYKKQ